MYFMKSISVAFIMVFTLFSCNSFDSAISYNDTIIEPQLNIITQIDSIYSDSEISVENIKKHRLELVSETEKAINEVRNLKDFKGNTSFRESAMKYFSHLNFLYNKTPNIDSLIYNLNSDERVINMSDKDYDFMEKELNKYLELENELLNEQ